MSLLTVSINYEVMLWILHGWSDLVIGWFWHYNHGNKNSLSVCYYLTEKTRWYYYPMLLWLASTWTDRCTADRITDNWKENASTGTCPNKDIAIKFQVQLQWRSCKY